MMMMMMKMMMERQHMGNKQKKVHLTNGSLQAKGDNAS